MLLLVVLSFSLLESIMLDNAVVAVWLVFLVHFLAKKSIRYGNLPYFLS
jgi:hypothetical protein